MSNSPKKGRHSCQSWSGAGVKFWGAPRPVSKFRPRRGSCVKFCPPVSKCQISAGPGAPTIPPLSTAIQSVIAASHLIAIFLHLISYRYSIDRSYGRAFYEKEKCNAAACNTEGAPADGTYGTDQPVRAHPTARDAAGAANERRARGTRADRHTTGRRQCALETVLKEGRESHTVNESSILYIYCTWQPRSRAVPPTYSRQWNHISTMSILRPHRQVLTPLSTPACSAVRVLSEGLYLICSEHSVAVFVHGIEECLGIGT